MFLRLDEIIENDEILRDMTSHNGQKLTVICSAALLWGVLKVQCQIRKDWIIQTSPVVAINRLKDPPTWLKVATALEKPPPPPTHIIGERADSLCAFWAILARNTGAVPVVVGRKETPMIFFKLTHWDRD